QLIIFELGDIRNLSIGRAYHRMLLDRDRPLGITEKREKPNENRQNNQRKRPELHSQSDGNDGQDDGSDQHLPKPLAGETKHYVRLDWGWGCVNAGSPLAIQ